MRLTIENLTREIADRDLHIATMTVDGVTAGGRQARFHPMPSPRMSGCSNASRS